ncbi:hypothetical protein AX15_000911 [Amanita polypyramis BW_CC]|nr:hypothetical protein AX15_000911 [Amanita polypyramis BW_CC]
MSVAPSPSSSRGQPVLQPEYFTSELYVHPLRQDILSLLLSYHNHYYSPSNSRPFQLFKHLWLSLRWHCLHFKVFDARSRHTFLTVTLRLFLEKTITSESPFTRTAALFGFYTFFYSQPVNTAPPLHSISHIPIAIDHYLSLKELPDLLTTPDLLPLRPYTVTVLGTLIKDQVFYVLPRAELCANSPRELPREQLANNGTYLPSETGKRKRGRPSKHDKAMKNKAMLDKLEKWMGDVTYCERSTEQSEYPHNLLAKSSGTSLEHYKEQKSQLLGALLSTGGGSDTIQRASATVMERLKGARDLVADEEQNDDFAGLERAKFYVSRAVDGAEKCLSLFPAPPSIHSLPSLSSSPVMAYHGPNSQRRYFPQQLGSPSTTNLLQPQQPILSSSNYGSAPHPKYAQGPPSLRSMPSTSSLSESPYSGVSATVGSRVPASARSVSDKYSLPPDPAAWGSNLSPAYKEDDDWLHNPDPRRDRKNDAGGSFLTYRGLTNLGCLIVLCVGLVTLFAGFPIISHFTSKTQSTLGGFNLGGINATGQVPKIPGNWGLIDLDTPQDAYTRSSYYNSGNDMQLVFSDEFNTDGRTFYPGDDPYWEAADLHYWATNNLEWYDPEAVTTQNGALEITLSQKQTHGLNYQSGMITTWNKFCFTGGLIEASVSLPGINNVAGLWPAIWTMGNLGRAGYGASLDGMWPYTYDACDVGTAPNQTLNGQPVIPAAAGDPYHSGALSYLPGQRLSRCTCRGESHPGPIHSDGTYVGRSAPEIDIFEATVDNTVGMVSQSAQWAPFNANYTWIENLGTTYTIINSTATVLNPYRGGAYQQATSGLTITDQNCYELATQCFSIYGFEYKAGFDNAYIAWISDNKVAWTVLASGLDVDPVAQISARPIPQEPMYIIMNLGISENFGFVDFQHLTFPTKMKVDYIRVYQPKNAINYGCNPTDFPTNDYIQQYLPAYTNPNLTTWVDDFKQPNPKNRLVNGCS